MNFLQSSKFPQSKQTVQVNILDLAGLTAAEGVVEGGRAITIIALEGAHVSGMGIKEKRSLLRGEWAMPIFCGRGRADRRSELGYD